MFNPLLRNGVYILVRPNISLLQILEQELKLPENTIEQDIQTILLNGHPVDELGSRIALEGSTLSLSAAIPGLAGTSLRRKGTYACLRQSISLQEDKKTETKQKQIYICLKLFNFMATKLGPLILKQGAWIEVDKLKYILQQDLKKHLPEIIRLSLNGTEIQFQQSNSFSKLPRQGLIFLQVYQSPDQFNTQ